MTRAGFLFMTAVIASFFACFFAYFGLFNGPHPERFEVTFTFGLLAFFCAPAFINFFLRDVKQRNTTFRVKAPTQENGLPSLLANLLRGPSSQVLRFTVRGQEASYEGEIRALPFRLKLQGPEVVPESQGAMIERYLADFNSLRRVQSFELASRVVCFTYDSRGVGLSLETEDLEALLSDAIATFDGIYPGLRAVVNDSIAPKLALSLVRTGAENFKVDGEMKAPQ